jgi:cytochrome c oxidase cbb3-type subunit III
MRITREMMRSRFAWIAMTALLAGGCTRETPARQAARSEGETLYRTHCVVCHGTTGDGSGQVPSHVDFTSRHWQEYRSDADIRSAIRKGVEGTAMPAFPSLSDQEVDAIVVHLRKLRR